ncbi:hypothetical protein HWV62_22309 [Athelia sp. TMB]|nr:hypothetical protein HWV62_22309 [Athelia sp. TMB]
MKLAGIVYVHPISDNRMNGTHMSSLRMLKTICGNNMSGITIITSMWNIIKDVEACEKREAELKSNWWKEYIQRGCLIERFYANDSTSARRIIKDMLQGPGLTLQLTKEIVDEKKPLSQTTAGRSAGGLRSIYKACVHADPPLRGMPD